MNQLLGFQLNDAAVLLASIVGLSLLLIGAIIGYKYREMLLVRERQSDGHLRTILIAQQSIFERSCEGLGDSVRLVDDLIDAYQNVSALIQASGVGLTDQILSVGQSMLFGQHQLIQASLAALRGHLNDSYLYSRRSIEVCAFAHRIIKHPHLAEVWTKAGDSDDAYDEYRRKFRPGKIFEKDHEFLGELYIRYDICSKLSHPSLYSFAGQLEFNLTEGEELLRFKAFQLRDEDKSEPIRTLLWIVATNFMALRLYVGMLSSDKQYRNKDAGDILNAFSQEFEKHTDAWEEAILAH
jgi:hypothetical protein